MGIKKDYDLSLDLLKQILNGSECEPWIHEIRHHFTPQPMRILDIGIGTGESINKRVSGLAAHGYTVELHGLDPILDRAMVKKYISCDVELFCCHFEDFDSKRTFNVLNANHSIYYFRDVKGSLRKMARLLQPGGLLTITLWSQECTLYQLQQAVFGQQATPLTAEKVTEQMLEEKILSDVKLVRCEGLIHLGKVRASEQMLDAVLTIISRKFDDTMLALS